MHIKEGEAPPKAPKVAAYVDLDVVWECLEDVRNMMRTLRMPGSLSSEGQQAAEWMDLFIVSRLAAAGLALLDPVDSVEVLAESGRAWVEIHKVWCRHYVAQAAMAWSAGYEHEAVDSLDRAREKLTEARQQIVRYMEDEDE